MKARSFPFDSVHKPYSRFLIQATELSGRDAPCRRLGGPEFHTVEQQGVDRHGDGRSAHRERRPFGSEQQSEWAVEHPGGDGYSNEIVDSFAQLFRNGCIIIALFISTEYLCKAMPVIFRAPNKT
jgi:hypothetical protein